MLPHPLEVPTGAIEFHEENDVRLLRIGGQRVEAEAIELRAFLEFEKRRKIELRLVVRRSSRK